MPQYLSRTDVAKELMTECGDQIVICAIGTPVSDIAGTGDRLLNFYLLGAMGSAASVGLGLALAQPQRSVLVVTGDSELMMNIGMLATIAVKRPKNLSIVVFDNEQFGETGEQTSHTAFGVDIAAIAAASGFTNTATIRDQQFVSGMARQTRKMDGPHLAVIKVKGGRVPVVIPEKDGVVLKSRFRRALLGTR
jgi:thiamine pyrophosphate-dependent acetolactate synthase large subunit-like protein